MSKAKGCRRLTVNVPEGFHREFKKLANMHNTTMSKLVLRMICRRIMDQRRLYDK